MMPLSTQGDHLKMLSYMDLKIINYKSFYCNAIRNFAEISRIISIGYLLLW